LVTVAMTLIVGQLANNTWLMSMLQTPVVVKLRTMTEHNQKSKNIAPSITYYALDRLEYRIECTSNRHRCFVLVTAPVQMSQRTLLQSVG